MTGAKFVVTIKDVGGSSTTTSATVNVAAPTGLAIQTLTPGSYTEGVTSATTTVATFTDANPGFSTANLAAVVTFGDGTSLTQTLANHGLVQNGNGSYSVLANHRYAEEGSSTMSVQVSDGTGDTTSTAAAVATTDAALRVLTLTRPSPTHNVSFTSTVLTFTDANVKPDGKDFTAVITWGDGSSSTETVANGGITGTTTFSVTGTHTYASAGNYNLSIQVTDVGGSTTSTSALVSVK
jgi:hypothetical protein